MVQKMSSHIFTAEEATVLAFIAKYPDPQKRRELIDKLQGKARIVAEALIFTGLQPEDPELAKVVFELKKWAADIPDLKKTTKTKNSYYTICRFGGFSDPEEWESLSGCIERKYESEEQVKAAIETDKIRYREWCSVAKVKHEEPRYKVKLHTITHEILDIDESKF